VIRDRDAIVAATDLPALADQLLGPSRNRRWPCPNPDHPQTGRTPPVTIFRPAGGDARWRCHGCGIGGTAIDLLMAARGVDVTTALDTLAAGHPHVRHPAAGHRPPAAARPQEPLDDFVAECAERLWRREGATVRRWAMGERHLSEDALRRNHVGADPGRRSAHRPAALPAGGPALVLPTHQHTANLSVQLRLLRPRLTGAKYLSPRGGVGTARLATYTARDETATTIVTEGPLDALSAATLGYRAVAVLGVAAVDARTADHLAAQPGRLVLAFDADPPGQAAQARLAQLLAERGRPPAGKVPLPAAVSDLNEWLVAVTSPAVIARAITGDRHAGLGRGR
jgi:hypothetical protein